ncbi:major facilitator superfamily domain-containing protein [Aspergillus pseudoustus]|uniref:Major facilitator superfamily domain-containing protein n=1 Tax=Aspergillus pseudoustus TaxID=1810923 RepID=A0ABR4JVU8_9EURO
MSKFRSRLYKTDRARDFEHEQDRQVRTRQIYETIDRQSFQWVVVLVAGVGFFLDGYTLFASNIALPMIAYVYWRDETSSFRLTCINIATLAGTLFGQVLFGYLADRNGRKKMYGVELALLITSTLGVAMSSTGENGSMSVFAWLVWWRIVVGIGVGADYPLSAVITSEFAPTRHRARMIASVFFMQPLGQIAGNVVSLIVVVVSKKQGFDDITRTVDVMWRWVVAIGVVPGVIATLFRFFIPESPRYLLEIEDDPVQAEFDATTLFSDPGSPEMDEAFTHANNINLIAPWSEIALPLPAMATTSIAMTSHSNEDTERSPSQAQFIQPATLNSHWRLSRQDIHQYFWTEGNWRTLAATSLSWLLLDFGFYGIGLSSPQFLAKTWGSLNLNGPAPPWMTDDTGATNIYNMFQDSSTHCLVILNTGSFVGGILLLCFIHKLDRVSLQKYGFLALAAHFIALGTMFITVHKEGPVAVCLYVLGQILFNFGPNATTYIIPAEIFPTRYRATCHGISAGAGKLGSILIQVFSAYYKFGTGPGDNQTIRHGWMLIVFSACMMIGAAVTHFWIPPVQRRERDANGILRGKFWGGRTETLETLGMGRQGWRSRFIGVRR